MEGRAVIEARKNILRKNPEKASDSMINAAAMAEIRKEQAFVEGARDVRQQLINRNAEILASAGAGAGAGAFLGPNYPALQEMLRLKEERKGLFTGLGLDEKERRKRIYKQYPEHMRNLVTREERGPSFLDGYNRAALAEIRAEDVSSPENIGHVALQQYNREKRVVRNREEEEAADAGNVARAEKERMRDINPTTEGKRKAEWLFNAIQAGAEDTVYGADFNAKIERLRENYLLAKRVKEKDENLLREKIQGGWLVAQTPMPLSDTYYYNPTTGESTYKKPTALSAEAMASVTDFRLAKLNERIKINNLKFLAEREAWERVKPTVSQELARFQIIKKELVKAIKDIDSQTAATAIQVAMKERLLQYLHIIDEAISEQVSKMGGNRRITRKHKKGQNKKRTIKNMRTTNKYKKNTRKCKKI